jgi:hypothetical protein
MKKLIKNYTTEVPLQKTITEIHHLLAENGATGIATEYDKGRIRDIFFKIKVAGKELAFRLPAKPDKVYAVLHGQTMSHYHDRYGEQWHDQAERVAWRICKSWLNRNTQDWYSHICGSEIQDTVEPAIVGAPSRASLRAVRARVSQSAVV